MKHIYFPKCQVEWDGMEWNGIDDEDVLLSISIFGSLLWIRIDATKCYTIVAFVLCYVVGFSMVSLKR